MMTLVEELRLENHRLIGELMEAVANKDDEQIDIIHEIMMTNKDLMLFFPFLFQLMKL